MAQNADGNDLRMRPRSKCSIAVKKAHTDGYYPAGKHKNGVVVNRHSQTVVYLSPTQAGSTHDKQVADEAAIVYPLNATLGKDTGFQGYEPPNVVTWQPQKKPKGQALAVADLFVNRGLSSARIVVEHGLAGVKRSRIVKQVFRHTKTGLSDRRMDIACALHNLSSHFRHPLPTFNILAMLTCPFFPIMSNIVADNFVERIFVVLPLHHILLS